jgi:hypothetical protein
VPDDSKVSRRDLLSTSCALAAGSAIGKLGYPLQTNPILGSGSHRYECIHDWLQVPDHIKLGDTHGVAQDSHGRIYIAHTVHSSSQSHDAICVFASNGNFAGSWGAQFRGGAHGLDLRKEGSTEYLYHCDVAHNKVVKTSLTGEVIWEKGIPSESGKYPNNNGFTPTNVAFSPDGGFFVGDGYGSSWIHQYDKDANYVRSFGGPGNAAGNTNCPHGLWLDDRSGDPLLAVADRGNRRIQYFDLEGKHVKFVTEGVRMPCHFSTKENEMLFPDLESVVTILDEDNKVIIHLGDGHPSNLRDHSRKDFVPGKFIHPHDAMFLANGDILVAEWVPIGRITLLKKLN